MAGFGAFLIHVFFSLPQEEEKNLKKNFSTTIIFDFSNYTNYIHIFITCSLFPTGFFLQLISLLGDLKCS